MKTVKITKHPFGYRCEFLSNEKLIGHGSYPAYATGDMAIAAAKWCTEEPVPVIGQAEPDPESVSDMNPIAFIALMAEPDPDKTPFRPHNYASLAMEWIQARQANRDTCETEDVVSTQPTHLGDGE